MKRSFWVWLHRWTGLLLTGFLVLVGITGSVLAFRSELERLICPQLYATPRPGVAPLDAAALALRAEALVPEARVYKVALHESDQAIVMMQPLDFEAERGKLGFDQLILDPWTGKELGRRTWGAISEGSINLIPFIFTLHFQLALGMTGHWILGFVALAWTIDCFNGFYLTLPARAVGFWRRWKPAWRVKWTAGAFRINFDLHRAGGLWLWAALLVFAWSSVKMNLFDTVYTWTTSTVLEFKTADTELPVLEQELRNPVLGWREAVARGETLMADEARARGFQIDRPVALLFLAESGVYEYVVHSSLDIQDKRGMSRIYLDANTGALRLVLLPSGQFAGNTVTSWLYTLHEANVFGLPYRIFVCALGLAITMLSVTGVYIWWTKRKASRFRKALSASTGAPLESMAIE